MEIKRDVENAKLLDNFLRRITKYMSIFENRFTRDADLIGVSSNEPKGGTQETGLSLRHLMLIINTVLCTNTLGDRLYDSERTFQELLFPNITNRNS